MQDAQTEKADPTARNLRPVVRIVVAAELAISALLMTTVQWPAPQAPTAQIAVLR